MMVYSSHDMLALVFKAFSSQGPLVIGKAAQKAGKPLGAFMNATPPQAKVGWATVRMLSNRYARGDYRHDEVELGQLEAFCLWLIQVGQDFGGHQVRGFTIQPAAMTRKEPLPKGSYAQLIVEMQERGL